MSVRPYDFLRSPYDRRTMLVVRPSFVYYQTCTTSQYIMAPPKEKGKRSKKETPQHNTDEEDEPGEKQAACTERQNRAVFRRPAFYDIYLLSRKIPVPVGNGTDFSSCAPLKTHSDHEILLLMVFPFSGTYFLHRNTQIILFLI